MDLFDISTMDKSHASYRRPRMRSRDIVEEYIKNLEEFYNDHRVLERAQRVVCRIQDTKTQEKI